VVVVEGGGDGEQKKKRNGVGRRVGGVDMTGETECLVCF
jgi:hypothetical protein